MEKQEVFNAMSPRVCGLMENGVAITFNCVRCTNVSSQKLFQKDLTKSYDNEQHTKLLLSMKCYTPRKKRNCLTVITSPVISFPTKAPSPAFNHDTVLCASSTGNKAIPKDSRIEVIFKGKHSQWHRLCLVWYLFFPSLSCSFLKCFWRFRILPWNQFLKIIY